MPDDVSPLAPPSSPPHGPVIPKGLATYLGVGGAAVFFVLACAIYAFDLDINIEGMTAAGLAAVSLYVTVYGRMQQAAAAMRDAPSPRQTTLGR